MSFSGDLKGIQLPDVFQNIHANRLTGTIRVQIRQGERFIYFEAGMVAGFSLGTNKGLPIAAHLAQRGYVEETGLQDALRRKAKNKKPLRVVLADRGLLDEDGFRGAVAELVEEHVFDVLQLKEATYEFTEGDRPPRVFDAEQKSVDLALDPSAVLMESARRQDEWQRIHNVVASKHDLFVVIEGWDQVENELHLQIGELLDGRTDIETVLESLPYSRFDVLKALSDMVKDGRARPLTATELEQMTSDVLADGDPDEAIALLQKALLLERHNTELRLKLIEVFEIQERWDEAAAELALLAYQRSEDGDTEDALALYARAAELSPQDMGLHERRLQLLAASGRTEEHASAVLAFVDVLMELGLADRARGALQSALEQPELKRHVMLLQKLAMVEIELGQHEEAARIYLDLAGRQRQDEDKRLDYLRRALECRPEDSGLRKRVADLETGEQRQRRTRRRRLAVWAASAATLLVLLSAGIVEFCAKQALLNNLESNLERITRAEPDALLEISQVADRYPWTMAGRQASRLAARALDLNIRRFEEMLEQGEHGAALRGLEQLERLVEREDARRRLAALIDRAKLEQEAQTVFERVNNRPQPDRRALEALSSLTDPRHLDFLLARLRDRKGTLARTRRCLLQALVAMDSPRALPVVARLYVTSTDRAVDELARTILARAEHHRQAGRDAAWTEVYGELEKARRDPATAKRAAEVLLWLRGD